MLEPRLSDSGTELRILITVEQNLISLLVIVTLAAVVPIILGFIRLRIAEVVLLLAGGIIFGPEVLG